MITRGADRSSLQGCIAKTTAHFDTFEKIFTLPSALEDELQIFLQG